MYNVCDSLTSWHKITFDGLTKFYEQIFFLGLCKFFFLCKKKFVMIFFSRTQLKPKKLQLTCYLFMRKEWIYIFPNVIGVKSV